MNKRMCDCRQVQRPPLLRLDPQGRARAERHIAYYFVAGELLANRLIQQDRDWARFLETVCPDFQPFSIQRARESSNK